MEFENLLNMLGDISEEAKEELKNALDESYESGRRDQIAEQEKKNLEDLIISQIEEAGALDTELVKSVIDMDAVAGGDVLDVLPAEIKRVKKEYGFLFRQDGPQFSREGSKGDDFDISSLNYMERFRLFKENPDLYKLHLNK